MQVYVHAFVILVSALLALGAAILALLVILFALLCATVPFERFVLDPIHNALHRYRDAAAVVSSGWFMACSLGGLGYGLCLTYAAYYEPLRTLSAILAGIVLSVLSAAAAYVSHAARS